MTQPLPQRLCKQSDLELALGGASVAVQLLDKDKDGIADPPLVDLCCAFGTTHVAGKVWPRVDIGTLQEPFPDRLVMLAAQVAAYKAWLVGAEGQAVPPHVGEAFDMADKVCREIAEGRDTVGAPPKPALDPPAVGASDYDPQGTGVSVRGFKQGGFR